MTLRLYDTYTRGLRAFEPLRAPDVVDQGALQRFRDQIDDDLNMPRAMAVTWDLVRSDVPAATRKATLLQFDRVLGLRLAEWQLSAVDAPQEIWHLMQEREEARSEKRWQEADALRERVRVAGYDIDDTPQGPQLRAQ